MKEFDWVAKPRTESTVLDQVLVNRGVDLADKDTYLRPALTQMHDPYELGPAETIVRSAERIAAAIRAKEKIVVYGDYDVDGVTGTATMLKAIRHFGGVVESYIPNRLEEGYGLQSDAVNRIIDDGAKLIVSVDCGITAFDQALICKNRNIDLIITDHHLPKNKDAVPFCYSHVHPLLHAYPNPGLCGSGVAFKVAWALGREFNEHKTDSNRQVSPEFRTLLLEMLVFTAMATIADVMPLTGENRVMVKHGLRQMRCTSFQGVSAMLDVAGIDPADVDAEDVKFKLAPRINAAGRMGHANLALNLLMSDNFAKAMELAQELDNLNSRRQAEEKKIVAEAIKLFDADQSITKDFVVLVGPKSWHGGVIGLVAQKLVEHYKRPAIAMIEGDEKAHGSGRTYGKFSIIDALNAMPEGLMGKYGGHHAACGVNMKLENVAEFRKRLCEIYRNSEVGLDELKIDCEAKIEEVNLDLAETLRLAGPFGQGNPTPRFVFRNVKVLNKRGSPKSENYIFFQAGHDGTDNQVKATCFKDIPALRDIAEGGVIDIVGTVEIDTFRGKVAALKIQDAKLSQANLFRTLTNGKTVAYSGHGKKDQTRGTHIPNGESLVPEGEGQAG